MYVYSTLSRLHLLLCNNLNIFKKQNFVKVLKEQKLWRLHYPTSSFPHFHVRLRTNYFEMNVPAHMQQDGKRSVTRVESFPFQIISWFQGNSQKPGFAFCCVQTCSPDESKARPIIACDKVCCNLMGVVNHLMTANSWYNSVDSVHKYVSIFIIFFIKFNLQKFQLHIFIFPEFCNLFYNL